MALFCLMAGHDAVAQLNKEYFFWVGRRSLIDNRYQDAIETLNILLKVDPGSHEAYFLRGIAKYNLDDLLGAELDFTQAIAKNPVYTMAYQYRAITRTRLGNYDDALSDFREAIDLRPDLPDPFYSRGVTYLLSQQYEKAVEDFNQFIRHENKVADAYINRGIGYLHLKDTVRAYEDFNTAIRTNRNNPEGYNRRGRLYLEEEKKEQALADFNRAITCDTTYIAGYFNRALVYAGMNRLMPALADFDRVIALDSVSSLTYFNRAILRTQIGDYNRALDDYDQVARYSPGNVLVYFNRASLKTMLGDLSAAIADYDRAIELYPDFANAYLNRASLRYLTKDTKGARQDRNFAEKKIAEYRSKLNDSTFSIYADTSRKFNRLLAFDTKFGGNRIAESVAPNSNEMVTLLPMFRFIFTEPKPVATIDPQRYYLQRLTDFLLDIDNPLMSLTTLESTLTPDSLLTIDRTLGRRIDTNRDDWRALFEHAITQGLIRQYTNAVNTYSAAIERNPTNPFLYLNRSTTRAEMIDFISSIDNSYQRITIDNDPAKRLINPSHRTYNYDEAIADLNKAAKLFPQWAHIYYNRGNLQALSGNFPEAFDDYTRALEQYPNFAEAYYNRGLVQIYMKDTRKGCLDLSKAGELGVQEAYTVLRRYARSADEE